MEYDIGDQFDRFGRIAFERRGMDYRLFLGRIGIQFPAEVFETAVDVVGFAVCRAFEKRMLEQVGQTIFRRQFVAAARIDCQCAMCDGRAQPLEDAPDAVGKRILD